MVFIAGRLSFFDKNFFGGSLCSAEGGHTIGRGVETVWQRWLERVTKKSEKWQKNVRNYVDNARKY